MKQPKINEEVTLTLKFRVEEAKEGCTGCWGTDNYNYFKCDFIRGKFGDCGLTGRKDKTNIIFKLIKEKQ